MHMEIQVALTFVISYLYNKLPRRRVNIFGEELEKALKHKFQGHWYPEKPFKGSAFRCLKTGEPMDAVLEIAARESGVPIGDILENLPAELSVWVDPGEVSYRIGEKGAVKILYSEQKHDSQEDNSADREVTSTFNPEAQCFRPIEIVGASLNGLTLSPKGSPNDSSSTSSTSPMYKNNSPSGIAPTLPNGTTFLGRTQEPIQFTTATFAQTKFGSTKLKNNSKRTNSRMSPTEFSNYIKQRQMQQHNHFHGHQPHPNAANNGLYGAIGSISPARSISPNPMTLQMPPNDQSMQASPHQQQQQQQNSFVFQNGGFGMNMYQSFGSPRNVMDSNGLGGNNSYQYNGNSGNDALLFMTGNGKCSSSFLDQQAVAAAVGSQSAGFCKIPGQQATQQGNQTQQQQQSNQNSASGTNNNINNSSNNNSSTTVSSTNGNSSASASGAGNQQQSPDSKLLDGMNSFYNNSNSSYQHLLVAN